MSIKKNNPLINLPLNNFTFEGNYLLNQQFEFDIHYALERHNSISIIGRPGSGKTFLINHYINSKLFQALPNIKRENIVFLNGYELEYDKTSIQKIEQLIKYGENSLLIIDEFETVDSLDSQNPVINKLLSDSNGSSKTIIVSRKKLEGSLANLTYEIDLGEGRIDKNRIINYIKSMFPKLHVDSNETRHILNLIENFGFHPTAIVKTFDLLLNSEYNASQIKSILERKLYYKANSIELISENNIVLAEQPKIITDIKLTNQSLLAKVSRDPNFIHNITSRQFEELVAEIFEKKGYKVNLTKQTQDGGKDLVIIEDKILGNFVCYVECKQYGPNKPVGVRIIRELFGTVSADRVTAGVVVTSSYFSESAYNFTNKVKNQISLVDYLELYKIINDVSNK